MPHRLKLVIALATFTFLSLLSVRALAHDVPKPPPNATSAVVRVDAYEHESFGAVIGDGHLVLVPYDAIKVARPGFPHAIVIDASGRRHGAGIAATDRAAGLALLAVDQPLTATPFALSASRMSDVIDTFAIAIFDSGPVSDASWGFYPAGTLAGPGRVSAPTPHPGAPQWSPRDGSPIIDVQGRLVGIMGAGLAGASAIDVPEPTLARLDGTQRARSPVLFYGGTDILTSFAPGGGGWFGVGVSFGARVRDVVELRLDTEFAVLFPVKNAPKETCGGRCYAGLRGVATPSVGYRHVIGGVGGARAFPIALTPSVGLALGVQDTERDNGAPAYDAATPSTWAQPAPGLALSLSVVELRGRVRIPLDDSRAPTVEIGIGVFF